MTGSIVFDPLLPWPVLAALAALALAGVALALWRGLAGWALRGLAALVLLAALAGPVYQVEDRAPLTDIVVMLEDDSASQSPGDRAAQDQRGRRDPGRADRGAPEHRAAPDRGAATAPATPAPN